MKRLIAIILVSLFSLLAGCDEVSNDIDKNPIERYESYIPTNGKIDTLGLDASRPTITLILEIKDEQNQVIYYVYESKNESNFGGFHFFILIEPNGLIVDANYIKNNQAHKTGVVVDALRMHIDTNLSDLSIFSDTNTGSTQSIDRLNESLLQIRSHNG